MHQKLVDRNEVALGNVQLEVTCRLTVQIDDARARAFIARVNAHLLIGLSVLGG